MFNPFTPSFGGKPEHFFGRTALLSRVRVAVEGDDCADHVLFITGPRGCCSEPGVSAFGAVGGLSSRTVLQEAYLVGTVIVQPQHMEAVAERVYETYRRRARALHAQAGRRGSRISCRDGWPGTGMSQ